MKLLILGCGTIIQHDRAGNCSGYLLDRKILIDCGPGIWRALHHHQIRIAKVNHILLSHFHVDHTSDLAPILQERYLTLENHDQSLVIAGPEGLKAWFKNLTDLIGEWSERLNIHLIEMDEKPLQLDVYMIRTKRTLHTTNSLAYRIGKKSKQIFYSGDTDYSPDIQEFARGCNMAIMEASHTEATKLPGHLTPRLAGKMAAGALIGTLVLTHRYPEVTEDTARKSAAREFAGEVIIAGEGMEIGI